MAGPSRKSSRKLLRELPALAWASSSSPGPLLTSSCSTVAKNFMSELDDLFKIDGGLEELDQKVHEKYARPEFPPVFPRFPPLPPPSPPLGLSFCWPPCKPLTSPPGSKP